MNPFDPGLEIETPLVTYCAAVILWAACWRAMIETWIESTE